MPVRTTVGLRPVPSRTSGHMRTGMHAVERSPSNPVTLLSDTPNVDLASDDDVIAAYTALPDLTLVIPGVYREMLGGMLQDGLRYRNGMAMDLLTGRMTVPGGNADMIEYNEQIILTYQMILDDVVSKQSSEQYTSTPD